MMSKYYDATKLLSMLDINGKKPEIYMCTTNRTGGKTAYEVYKRNMAHILGMKDEQVKVIETCQMLADEVEDH